MRIDFPEEYDFFPLSFELPKDRGKLLAYAKEVRLCNIPAAYATEAGADSRSNASPFCSMLKSPRQLAQREKRD
jgi:hypothetical protein